MAHFQAVVSFPAQNRERYVDEEGHEAGHGIGRDFAEATAHRLEAGLHPAKDMPFPCLGWTPEFLYVNHPRGKDPRFYHELD